MGATYSRATPLPRRFACRRCGDPVYVDSSDERRKDRSQGHVTNEQLDAWMLEKAS